MKALIFCLLLFFSTTTAVSQDIDLPELPPAPESSDVDSPQDSQALEAGRHELSFAGNLQVLFNTPGSDDKSINPMVLVPSIQPEYHYFITDTLYTGAGLNITWLDYGIFDGIAAQVPIELAEAITLMKLKLYIPVGMDFTITDSIGIFADLGPVLSLHIPLMTHGSSSVADDVLSYWYSGTNLFSLRLNAGMKNRVYETLGYFIQVNTDVPILNAAGGIPALHHFYVGGAIGITLYL